ncbi:hypothetical protein AXF42_Ash002540 [Apostasia shenzhenica]|uniref:Uncharacterized protein n=1 Tax=Apostasia shenzhenica TaxID=1088818 RepID=A0A2I0AP36_9ASPA|nr:hypothetical protein AXF42_Ash002540 [Apostasia shenzhenica]
MWGSQETPKRKRVLGDGGAQRGEPVNESSREKAVQSIQRNTQKFKVVQGGNLLRPPVDQRRRFH